MARIAGVDIPREKRVEVALTYIFGIGPRTSQRVLTIANIDPNIRVKNLSDDQVGRLRDVIDKEAKVEGELRREIALNIKRLMDVTRESLDVGIHQALAGNRIGDISAAVQEHVERAGFSVVRQFVGHGIGRDMHEDPQVPNFGIAGRGPLLKPGMVLAIEPMVNAGGPDVALLGDGWTVVTADHSLSAYFEHSVAITTDGPEILTASTKALRARP